MESQKEHLLRLFHENGNRITLGQILSTPLAAEYRARCSELRKEGYAIICVPVPGQPSLNVYTLFPPPAKLQFDARGQGDFLGNWHGNGR